jgi:hypothetical protein
MRERALGKLASSGSVCWFFADSGSKSIVTSYGENMLAADFALCRFLPQIRGRCIRFKQPTGRFPPLSSSVASPASEPSCREVYLPTKHPPSRLLNSTHRTYPDFARRRCWQLAHYLRRHSEWRSPIILAGLDIQPDASEILVTD